MKVPVLFSILCYLLLSCQQKEGNHDYVEDTPFHDQALQYLKIGKVDSSFFMFDRAKDFYLKYGDSLQVANCLIRMAMIQREQGDYFGAQETSLQAIPYLNESNPEHHIYLSSTYNLLARSLEALRVFDKAIVFYGLALGFSDSSSNTFLIRNNLAISYRRMGNYGKAFEIFEGIIQETEKTNPTEYARVLSNYAMAKFQQDPAYNAVPELLNALYIRVSENDLNGLNASYAHLSDYYEESNPDSALFYANRQYEVANRIKNPDSRLRALDRLIMLSPGDFSKRYYKPYKQISDSLYQARTSAKNQFAVIRYEVEKSKAENLRLEKVNTERSHRLARQRFMTAGTGLLLLFTIVGGRYWYRKRQQRLELEAQDRIKASQLRTSRKVHDVVANGIYRVMSEIEYKDDINRGDILDKLEDMYHKSRDISYETEESLEWDQPYHERLAGLIKSFAHDFRSVFIVGNESELWDTINEEGRAHIQHVLQELMVNMDKHSQAANVVVRFEKNADSLTIYYSDDGVGLKRGTAHGNGLTNTVSRIESLGGKITFVEGQEKGFKIEIRIPFL